MMRFLAIAAVALLTVAPAQAESDVQGWLTVAGDVRLDPDTAITGVVVLRSRPDRAELAQAIGRIGIRQGVGDGRTVEITYALVDSVLAGRPDQLEHRFGQNFSTPLATIGRARIDGRVGMEQRLPDGGGALSWRLRGRIQWVMPLTAQAQGGPDLRISEELIGSLNDTAWGQQSGLTASRLGVGIRLPLSPRLGLTPSYAWQHIFLEGRNDRNDHVLGLTIDAHF
jgi:hypothetical protein